MNFKKILAGLAAGAMAASTLAAVAYAASYDIMTPGDTYYIGSFSSGDGTVMNLAASGETGTIDVSWEIPSGTTIKSYRILLEYFTHDGFMNAFTTEGTDAAEKIEESIRFTSGAAFTGITNVYLEAPIRVSITGTYSTTDVDGLKAIVNDDGENPTEGTWIGINDVLGQPYILGDTTPANDWNGIWLGNDTVAVVQTGDAVYQNVIDFEKYVTTKAEKRAFVDGGTITLTLEKASDKTVILPVKFEDAADGSDDFKEEIVITTTNTVYTIDVPAGFFAYNDEDLGEYVFGGIVTIEGLKELGVGFSVVLSTKIPAEPEDPDDGNDDDGDNDNPGGDNAGDDNNDDDGSNTGNTGNTGSSSSSSSSSDSPASTTAPSDSPAPSPALTLDDGDTGVTVAAAEGVLPEGTTLKVEQADVEEGATGVAFDITLIGADGAAVQPDGSVAVTIEIPEVLAGSDTYYVFHEADNGTLTNMNAVLNNNGTVTFTTTHFSTYILSTVNLLAGESSNNTTDGNPHTGAILVLIPAAIAAAGVIASRKRK